MATSGVDLGLSGLASGFDWKSFIDQMMAVERIPQQRVRTEQAGLNRKREALGTLVSALTTLQERAKALTNVDLFGARSVAVTNSVTGLATASASANALLGDFQIEVTQAWNGANWSGSTLTGTFASSGPLATPLSDLSTPPTTSTGSFTLNGKTVSLTSSDTVASAISKINAANAGVSARFDAATNQVVLASTTSSSAGSITIADDADGFAAALGFTTGTGGSGGSDLQFQVNGGAVQTSTSRILTESQTGLVGLTVTVAGGKTGIIDLSSTQNSSTMRTAITDFVEAYNKVQSLINTQTATSTDSSGKVISGVLSFDRTVEEVASKLRRTLVAAPDGAPAGLERLDLLGFSSNGSNDQITLTDGSKLDAALANNPDGVRQLFATAGTGLASLVSTYITNLTDSTSGVLVTAQSNLQKQAARLDTQLADMERLVRQSRERLTASFLALERTQAQLNQQLQYLQQRFQ